jgi:hypothetical protein
VYAPGQFFVPHQDSEKEDGMIATLVVTLPSNFSGGAIVVKHHEEKVAFRGSSPKLGLNECLRSSNGRFASSSRLRLLRAGRERSPRQLQIAWFTCSTTSTRRRASRFAS